MLNSEQSETAVDALRVVLAEHMSRGANDLGAQNTALRLAALSTDLRHEARTFVDHHRVNANLWKSIYDEDVSGAEMALKQGANANGCLVQDARCQTMPPLHVVSGLPDRQISKKLIALLVKYGADLNQGEPLKGITPLMYAAVAGKLHAMRALLKAGADPNITCHMGETALYYCEGTVTQLRSMMKDLVNAGANINHQDVHGVTPLHSRVLICRHRAPIQCLLELGADITIENNCKMTPRHWAMRTFNIEALIAMAG